MKPFITALFLSLAVFNSILPPSSNAGELTAKAFITAITADTPTGKFGVIGDSLAAGIHTSDKCGNRDIVDCLEDLLGAEDQPWSYAAGSQSWSIASLLGYTPERVVDASTGGDEWKDAMRQAEVVMNDPAVETVFIGLGANDVCQAYGEDYTGDLQTIAQQIDATLTFLTDRLPANGRIYWSGVTDIVTFRNLMVQRNHDYTFESCQGTWDIDGSKIKNGAATDACAHYFGSTACESANNLEQAKDELLELILEQWKEAEDLESGPCGKVLDSRSTEQDRAEARQFNIDLNALMAEKAQAFNGRNGVTVAYNDRVFTTASTIAPYHVSRLDCFHLSRAGQLKYATEVWQGFNPDYNPVRKFFAEEFNTQDFCAQDLTPWASCWLEIGENDGATVGEVRIDNQELRIQNNEKGLVRSADLSGVNGAILSFNYRRENLDDSDDNVEVEISPDGGQTWQRVDRIRGDADEQGIHRGNYYDISQYAAAATQLRLLSSDDLGDEDRVFFDNIEIFAWSDQSQNPPPPTGQFLFNTLYDLLSRLPMQNSQ